MKLTEEQKAKIDALAKAAVEEQKAGIMKDVTEEIEKSISRSGKLFFPNVVKAKDDFDNSFSVARLIKAQVTNNPKFAEFELAEASTDWLSKASIDNNSGSGGGFVVPSQVSDQMIDYLDSKEVVRVLGASVYPMTSDKLDIPVDEGGIEAVYVKQSEEGSESVPEWGLRRMVARDMMVLVPISNDWLADVNPSVEKKVRESIMRTILNTEDRVYLMGTGLSEPLGITNTTGVQSVTTAALTALDFDTIADMIGKLEAADAEATGFACHPDVKTALMKIQDGVGRPIWWENPSNPVENRLRGVPVRMTTKLKYTSGGTTYYPIICAQWDQALIGQRGTIQIASSDQVKFYSNQTVIRAIFRHDFVCGQLNAFCIHLATA